MRKIPTLFVRDFTARPAHVTDQVTPGCEWVLAGEGRPTRKYDGTCVMLDEDGFWWARREVKPDKPAPPDFSEVEHDETTGKRVGWEPAERSSYAKYLRQALDHNTFLGGTAGFSTDAADLLPGTFELIGPKINGNPETISYHLLVRHGYTAYVDGEAMASLRRDFDGIRTWLCERTVAVWEGFVFHHRDGRMAKIKRKDFPQ